MSYWSDVYAGDAAVIVKAFQDRQAVDGPKILAHAELAGVVPDASGEMANTPNLLTELACSIAKSGSLTFSDSIAEHLAGDRDPTSAAQREKGTCPSFTPGPCDPPRRASSHEHPPH